MTQYNQWPFRGEHGRQKKITTALKFNGSNYLNTEVIKLTKFGYVGGTDRNTHEMKEFIEK